MGAEKDDALSDVDNLDGLSQEELIALEDKIVADEAVEAVEDKPAEDVKPDVKDDGDKKPDPDEVVDKEPDKPPEDEKSGDVDEVTKADDQTEELTKHVSPPSKWAQQRQQARELKEELAEAREAAAKADTLESELEKVKEQLDSMKEAMTNKGIDPDASPLDVLSEENIEEIRTEHGDELADMMKAVAVTLKKDTPVDTAKKEEQKPKEEKPAAEDNGPDEVTVAIEENNDLAYWKEKSPALWKMAVEKDDELLKDPEYTKLTYAERYAKVVEEVKKDVEELAKPKDKKGDDKKGDELPTSLSDSPGSPPSGEFNNSPVDRILNTPAEKQTEVYNAMSEKDRDMVDKALNI